MTIAAAEGGVRIAYELAGQGPPLLLVQGLGYSRWGWGPIVEPLAADFRVLSYDNRGVGESDVPPGPYTVAELAADAIAVLDDAGIERPHVVGASLGGMIAQELAISYPERVDRLVLACTTPGGTDAYPMPEVTIRLFTEAASLSPQEALRRFVVNALAEDGPLADELYERRLADPPDQSGWRAQAAAGMAFDRLDRLGEIKAPTLVLHGTADKVVDHRNARLLAERIPDSRVQLIPGTGHMLFWEQPDWFVQAVSEFLR